MKAAAAAAATSIGRAMAVSDHEIAKTIETVLRQSNPNAVTSLNDVVHQLEANLGLNLSHKIGFIRDQITFLLRSNPVPKDHLPPQSLPQLPHQTFLPQPFHYPHFANFQQQHHNLQTDPHAVITPTYSPQVQQCEPVKTAAKAVKRGKISTSAGTKRRGGPGGLNKVCGVSPELQAIVGEPALPRTEIVRQLWAYIRKHNLQDPGNKRKIICDDALRLVLETDCTDMFKMNKLLAKHIITLDPTKQSVPAKKLKIEDESTKQYTDSSPLTVVISDALARFIGTGEREMLQSKALGRVWEYISANLLADPVRPMVINCDAKLQELLGCESISALGIQEMLARHHLRKG